MQLPGDAEYVAEWGEPPVMGAERPSQESSQATSCLNLSSLTLISDQCAGRNGGGGGGAGGGGGGAGLGG